MSYSQAHFTTKHTSTGEVLQICSLWHTPITLSEPVPLCRLWVLKDSTLFYSDSDILTTSCNSSLVLTSFLQTLQKCFYQNQDEFVFNFAIDDESNIANLEILYKIDTQGTSFVLAFHAALLKSFGLNPVGEFLAQVARVCEVKNGIIEQQRKEIEGFLGLENQVQETRKQVEMMRNETGPLLAARFMVLLNEIKSKADYHVQSAKELEREQKIIDEVSPAGKKS